MECNNRQLVCFSCIELYKRITFFVGSKVHSKLTILVAGHMLIVWFIIMFWIQTEIRVRLKGYYAICIYPSCCVESGYCRSAVATCTYHISSARIVILTVYDCANNLSMFSHQLKPSCQHIFESILQVMRWYCHKPCEEDLRTTCQISHRVTY